MVDAECWQDYLLLVSTHQGTFLLEFASQEEFFEHMMTYVEVQPRRMNINSVMILTPEVFYLLMGASKEGSSFIIRGNT